MTYFSKKMSWTAIFFLTNAAKCKNVRLGAKWDMGGEEENRDTGYEGENET